MIVRTVIATADPAKLDEGVAFIRDEVQPAVDRMPGSYGLGAWVGRATGEVAVSTAWRDQAAQQASDESIASLRAEALRRLGAGEPRIELFEPVLISQSAPGFVGQWTRAVEIRHPVDRLEESLAGFKDSFLPSILEFPGVTLVTLLANRTTGLAVVTVAYPTEAEFAASRDRAERLRASVGRRGGTVERVTETQVAIVGLRSPVELPAQGGPVEFPANADA